MLDSNSNPKKVAKSTSTQNPKLNQLETFRDWIIKKNEGLWRIAWTQKKEKSLLSSLENPKNSKIAKKTKQSIPENQK